MRSTARSLSFAAAIAALRTSAASLADICTTSYVQSTLPADGFVEGLVLSPESVTVNAVYNYTVAANNLYPGKSDLDFCNVTLSYTREGLSNATPTNLWYWLPSPDQFQGRYLSTGGGGFAITSGEIDLSSGLVFGAASGTTDGGFGGWDAMLTDVVLPANGTIDWDILINFGYRSIHEMTVIGQGFTKSFYNSSSLYSYYQACSEGGREGWSQIQRYGTQFNGAAIGAPAFRMPFQQVIHLFSAVVETTNNYAPSPCELEKIRNDTITACDGLDGRVDGVVGRTDLCRLQYNASSSVGSSYSCATARGSPAANGTVTPQAAQIAEEIYAGLFDSKGRQAYISFQPAASFSDAATSYNATTGEYYASASGIGVQWVNYFLNNVASTALSLDNITYDTLRDWMYQGMQQYRDTVLTTWPDLTDFSNAGGKVIHFHGESDSSVPPASSVHYYNSVRQIMYPDLGFNESYAALQEFYRLFLIPGAEHCAPSSTQPNGPFPRNVLESVINWVELGVIPEQLNATVLAGTTTDLNQTVCTFPLRPYWSDISTMECVFDQASYETWVPDLNSFPMPVY
ncbi:Tannase/feruloyl esterase [Mycena sanguinolenta]|nr:Tannase/feruloyl esterase [Mycena sanguinolenta]